MTDDNLVLEHLKAIRNEIRDHKRSTDAGFKDLRSRMTGVETRLVGMRNSFRRLREGLRRKQTY